MQVDGSLRRKLDSMTCQSSTSPHTGSRNGQPSWRGLYRNTTRVLNLQSILNTYHPVLDNLSNYLSTRDVLHLTNTSKTLRTLFYRQSSCWRALDFSRSKEIPESRRHELMKSRRRIGYTLQNQSIYPETGLTSEIAIDLLLKIPLAHVKVLAFDGTDISDGVLKAFLNRTKQTLEYLSVVDCAHIQPAELLAYFSRVVRVGGVSRALKKIQFRGIPGVLGNTPKGDFIEGVSEIGEAVSGLLGVLASLNIQTDVGFCSVGIEYCQTVMESYSHAIPGDGVVGLRRDRTCGTCKKTTIGEAYCKSCEEERVCPTCAADGEYTFICRECQPESADGILWPHYCDCGQIMCHLCFDRKAVRYQDCPCFQCNRCEENPSQCPSERIAVNKYMCDNCGVDKCPKCWADPMSGVKLKKCIRCDKGLCEPCGVKLSCVDCNACICEDCFDSAVDPLIPQGYEWLCEYCHGDGMDNYGNNHISGSCTSSSSSASSSSSSSSLFPNSIIRSPLTNTSTTANIFTSTITTTTTTTSQCPTCRYFGFGNGRNDAPQGLALPCGCRRNDVVVVNVLELSEDWMDCDKESLYVGMNEGGNEWDTRYNNNNNNSSSNDTIHTQQPPKGDNPWTITTAAMASLRQKRMMDDRGGSDSSGSCSSEYDEDEEQQPEERRRSKQFKRLRLEETTSAMFGSSGGSWGGSSASSSSMSSPGEIPGSGSCAII
ncbi:hypothetical protein DFH27DRAFT_370664 [Peziza echinospora]|nr:hypothetical protein DFH27DRAFT_370664 [Peziza echinospora]